MHMCVCVCVFKFCVLSNPKINIHIFFKRHEKFYLFQDLE